MRLLSLIIMIIASAGWRSSSHHAGNSGKATISYTYTKVLSTPEDSPLVTEDGIVPSTSGYDPAVTEYFYADSEFEPFVCIPDDTAGVHVPAVTLLAAPQPEGLVKD